MERVSIKTSTPADSASREAESIAPPNYRISLTAEEFVRAIKEDEAAFNARFLNEEFTLTGTVEGVGALSYPRGYIYLAGIKWETEEKRPWEKVLPGQSVTVSIKYATGQPMKIETVAGERLVISAADIATEFQTNAAATIDKYLNTWLEIHGEIAEIETPAGEDVNALLVGSGDVRVRCVCSYEQRVYAETLAPGKEVRMAGRFAKPENEREILISSCFGITN